MTNERLGINLENNDQYSSNSIGHSFDESGYKRDLSGVRAEKEVVRKENDVKRMRLVDKLFGRKSRDTLPDNEIWEKIEGYLQEFKNNPDFIESKEPSQISFLDKIKNAKDRLEEPLIYEAVAFLLANIEKGGGPYRGLAGHENKGLRVKALLGKAHYEQFLRDKQKCINSFATEENKEKLQDAIANCEMDYIVNNIRGSNKQLKYFGYHSSKGRGKLPDEFADRVASLSKGQLYKFSVEEKRITHTNEKVNNAEKIQEFIKKNCSEPIEGVDTIISFKDFAQMMVKSAEEQVAKKQGWISRIRSKRVLKNIKKGNAKDKRIYELPAYKQLIKKGFILPSDVRTYYDSANREPVYHLGVDYNVKGGTEVKSMYKGKVVKSGLDGGLGHKVIIEHETDNGTKFYSLYGHLGSKNLPTVGQVVEKGMKIGEVGEAFTKDNGNWNSHLHFQIMKNFDSKRGYSKIEGEGNYDVLKSFGK